MFKKGQSGNKNGRPKGTTTRPNLLSFYSEKELADFVADLKESAKTDPIIKKFVAEQIFGKPLQAMELTGKDGESLFDDATRDKTNKAISEFIGKDTR